MKEAGFNWIRLGFPYPFKDKIHGDLNPHFLHALERAETLRRAGFKIMGVTPLAGSYRFHEKTGTSIWRSELPEWVGAYDSSEFYEAYREGCKEIGKQTIGIVNLWQISNEMDIRIFRGPMTMEQAARFLKAGLGIKEGNPEAKTSINPAGFGEEGRWLFENLYKRDTKIFDYAGIDGYFGSWVPGGPESWRPLLEKIHQITGLPLIIHEWGYSSIGRVKKMPQGPPPEGWNCYEKAWYHVWKNEHSQEEQAEYVETALKIFFNIPYLAGSFFFRWRDPPTCWQCGQPDCPSECGWGLLDVQGKPKKAYYAYMENVKNLFK